MANFLRRIDFQKRRFDGLSGKEYHILGSIPTGRYRVFQKLEIELGYGIDVRSLATGMEGVYNDLNSRKDADAAVKLHNYRLALGRLEEGRQDPMLYLCTLFCVTEGEDVAKWDRISADKKIEDWGDIDVQDFFSLAASSVPGLAALWLEVSQNTLEAESRKKAEL